MGPSNLLSVGHISKVCTPSASMEDTWRLLCMMSQLCLVNKRCSFQRAEAHTEPTKEGALQQDSGGVSSSARRVRTQQPQSKAPIRLSSSGYSGPTSCPSYKTLVISESFLAEPALVPYCPVLSSETLIHLSFCCDRCLKPTSCTQA